MKNGDYKCETVRNGMEKYNISDNWLAEFETYDDCCSLISVLGKHLQLTRSMLDASLRIIKNKDEEYAER